MRRFCGRPATATALAALLALVRPATAWAHSPTERLGDFYGGLVHLASALEHALPLAALGLLAGQNGRQAARWLLLAVPAALALGTSLAPVLPTIGDLGTINAASFLLVGLLLALDRELPPALLVALGIACGFSHGYLNGTVMAAGSSVLLFTLGTALAGILMIGVPSALTVSLVAGWQRAWRCASWAAGSPRWAR